MIKTKRLFTILVALVLTLALASTTTFAWFSMNERVNITGIEIDVITSEGMQIRANNTGSWVVNLDNDSAGMPGALYAAGTTMTFVPRTVSNSVAFVKEADATASSLATADFTLFYGSIENDPEDVNYKVYSEESIMSVSGYAAAVAAYIADNTDTTNRDAALDSGFFVQDFNIRVDASSTVYLSYLNVSTIADGDRKSSSLRSADLDLSDYSTTLTGTVTAGTPDSLSADGSDAVRIAVFVRTSSDGSTFSAWKLVTIIDPNPTSGYDKDNLAQDILNDSHLISSADLTAGKGLTDTKVAENSAVTDYDATTDIALGTFTIDGTAISADSSVADDFEYLDVRIVVWLEGKDGDCISAAIGDTLSLDISFYADIA